MHKINKLYKQNICIHLIYIILYKIADLKKSSVIKNSNLATESNIAALLLLK